MRQRRRRAELLAAARLGRRLRHAVFPRLADARKLKLARGSRAEAGGRAWRSVTEARADRDRPRRRRRAVGPLRLRTLVLHPSGEQAAARKLRAHHRRSEDPFHRWIRFADDSVTQLHRPPPSWTRSTRGRPDGRWCAAPNCIKI